MPKKISFIPTFMDVPDLKFLEIPQPSKNYIPQWYKDEKLFRTKITDPNTTLTDVTFKACAPFLDTFVSGYMMTLHQDIVVVKDGEDTEIKWQVGPPPLSVRVTAAEVRSGATTLPTPIGFTDDHWAWKFYFGMKVPKGYSILITHPLNRYDLPFISSSGIIDEFTPFAGAFSFWLKEGFEGIIPAGTPIAQILPFKRDDWERETREDLTSSLEFHSHEKFKKFGPGYYKNLFHKKKSYK